MTVTVRAVRAARPGAPVVLLGGIGAAVVLAGAVLTVVGAAWFALGLVDSLPALALVGVGVLVLIAGLAMAITASRRLVPLCTAAGALLVAEGVVSVWLGHLGQPVVVAGAVFVIVGVALTIADARPAVRTAVLAIGATLLLTAVVGVAAEAADGVVNRQGSGCLPGFVGDPQTHPTAPANGSRIHTGFALWPIGPTCSWAAGLPAAHDGVATTARTVFLTSTATSSWIAGTAAAGLLLLGAGFARRQRAR